jgi:isopenicillin N synthase-like dioxygenase
MREYIEKLKAFSELSLEVQQLYAPNRDADFLGYERGKEKFKRPDGTEVVDDSKASYYALVPDHLRNKWPKEVNLKDAFQNMGALMVQMGKEVMEKLGLLGPKSPIALDDHHVGRALYYCNRSDGQAKDDFWCGSHYDHGVFTALLPAVYFDHGKQVQEPKESGLFVRAANETVFKKVATDDPDVMYFQAGEFGQLATNDAIHATEHQVKRAAGSVKRYTMALFFAAKAECSITSTSVLTKDARWGQEQSQDPSCTYGRWHEASLARYHAK